MPGTLHLTAYRGDTFVRRFVFVDGAGEPIDQSAGTWAAQFRTHKNAAIAVDFDVDVSGAASGVVVASLDVATTAALPVRGVWDLQHTIDAAAVDTVLAGSFCTEKDVTR